MKTKYITLLVSVLGSSLSLGATISGLNSAYTKDSITYDGSNGDSLNVSSPTSLGVHSTGTWTFAFTVSDLSVTSDSDVGLLFTYSTTSNFTNLEGMGYQLSADGTLTLNVGGYNYTGTGAASSPWKTQILSNYSTETPLTLFYTFNQGTVSISAMQGDDANTFTTLSDLSGAAAFGNVTMTQINFSAKDTSGSTWNVPNGITGKYTLKNFDAYTTVLSEAQMKEYAASSVPEPSAATLSLLGLGAFLVRRRRA